MSLCVQYLELSYTKYHSLSEIPLELGLLDVLWLPSVWITDRL